jgi:hypothetical protein
MNMIISIKQPEAREPKKLELEFYQIPKDVLEKALKGAHAAAAVAVLAALYERYFRDKFHWNPVKLTNTKFRELGISPHTKLRGLRELESQGSVTVEWRDRRSPIVTLNWKDIKRTPALWNGTARL